MEPQFQEQKRSIDVTGLSDEAIRAVESLIAYFRGQQGQGGPSFSSRDDWARAIRQWAESHKPQGTSADYSRETIYAGRGE
jgi:hypothetical protein